MSTIMIMMMMMMMGSSDINLEACRLPPLPDKRPQTLKTRPESLSRACKTDADDAFDRLRQERDCL